MPINWQDGSTGGTPLSAANLNRLAVVADIGTTGTPTGDAVKAAAAAQVNDANVAQQVASGATTAAALRAAFGLLAARSATIATLGDSIGMNGGGLSMGVTTLTAAASAGATTVTVAAAEAPAVMSTDFAADVLVKIGTEYGRLTAAATGSGPYILTLGAPLASAHPVGEPVHSIVTLWNNGAPPAALVASLLSAGRLRYAGHFGHGGYTPDQLRRLYLPLVIAARPGWCYVMAGRNASNLSASDAVGQVAALWDALRNAGITPIASTLPPVNGADATGAQWTQRFNAALAREALRRGLPFDDLYARMVDPASGQYAAGLNADTVHPNAVGRFRQGLGIWQAIQATVPSATPGLPSTNAYGEAAVHPLPASQSNALMLTGGGASYGAGSTSSLPGGWATAVTDDVGKVTTVPNAAGIPGNAMLLTLNAGATQPVFAQHANGATLVPGHKYLFVARVKTTGISAAAVAAPSFGGLTFRITDNPYGGTTSFGGFDQMQQDIDGVISLPFICAPGAPTAAVVFVNLAGTAATGQMTAAISQVDILDVTALGEDADVLYP